MLAYSAKRPQVRIILTFPITYLICLFVTYFTGCLAQADPLILQSQVGIGLDAPGCCPVIPLIKRETIRDVVRNINASCKK